MFNDKKYLSAGKYLGFMCGVPGSIVVNTLVASFLLIFLTDTIGMNSAIIGTLMLISKFIDGASDIVFGAIMDRTHSKYGKARSWLMRMIIPTVICGVLLFWMPKATGVGAYAYFFIFYTLYSAVCYTVIFMAIQALPVRMTKNDNERVNLGVVSVIPQMAIGIVLSFLTMMLVNRFGGGVQGWRMVSLVFAAVEIVMVGICIILCKELPEEELNEGTATPVHEKFTLKGFLETLSGNKYIWMMFAYTIFFAIASTLGNSTGTYYVRYVLQNDSLLGFITLALLGPMIVALVLTPFLSKKFGVYKLASRGYVGGAVFALLMFIFALLRQPLLMFLFMVCRGLCVGPVTGIASALNGQIIEYSKVKDGKDVTGSLFGLTTLGGKVGEGLSSAIVGILLAAAGYDGMAQTQTNSAILMIIVIFAGLPFICYVIEAIALWMLKPAEGIKKIYEERGIDPESLGAPAGPGAPGGPSAPDGKKMG
jgi:glycoside/pentoside/hexuronide:cation symporter, GPH family